MIIVGSGDLQAGVQLGKPWSEWGGGGVSPTALLTGHRPLRVVLTVTEVGHEIVKPDNSTAAKHSVVTGNLQLGQHVPHDPRYWAQMGNRDNATVYWTRLLLGEPLGDAGVAESMLTMRCLKGTQGS